MTGAFLGTRTYEDFRYFPEELIRRLQMAGITQAYLLSEGYEIADFGEEFPAFLAAFKKVGIPVWIVVSDHIIYEKPQESFAHLNTLEHDYDKHLLRRITEFSATENVLGIALALTPHLRSHLRSRGLYSWSDATYGINNDNDRLIKQSMALIAGVRKRFRTKPLSVIVPEFYHTRAAASDLSAGKVTDFLSLADQVVVAADAQNGLAALRPQLTEAASLGRQLVICVSAGSHYSGRRFNLTGEDTFTVFMERLSKGLNDIRNVPGFGGIALMNFRGLEILLEQPE